MGGRTARAVVLASTILAGGALPARAQEGTWALTNVRIVTVTRGTIERGTLVIRDGLIAALGADVAAPADARVLDLAGRTVSPGLIDLTSTLGLPAAPAAGGGGGPPAPAGQQTTGPTYVGLEPERVIAEELRPSATDVKSARDAGITAVLVAPNRGAFRGQSALVPLRDSVTRLDLLRTPVAMHLGFQGVQGRFPSTLLGVMAYQRQKFHDARRQALLQERYRANARGMPRPSSDPALMALVPVVKGELPVFYAAGNENEIRRAAGMARELGLSMTIVGATEGFRAVDALRAMRRPVVVSVDFPRASDVTGWQYRGAQRSTLDSAAADSLTRRVLEGNAAALNSAGVPFALASGGLRATEFLANVRKAIAAGLARDTALVALTIRAAEAAGVAEQLGSIEVGKIANLVVSERDLLGDSTRIQAVFVDGIRYTVDAPPAPPASGRGGRAAAGAETADVGGAWDITISTPQGEQAVTMTVTQSGASFTGSMASQMGTSDISGGLIEGQRATWSMTLSMGGQSMTITYTAEIDGNRMTGTASVGEFGSFPFRGEKRP